MKVKNDGEFCSLLDNPTRQKRKLKTYAVLTPAIAREIETSDMTPEGEFLTIVKYLRTTIPASTEYNDETTSSTTTSSSISTASASEEDILKNIGSPFESVLRFLWAVHHHPTVITVPTTVPLQDETTMSWEKESRERELPQESSESNPSSTAVVTFDDDQNASGATMTITKLAASMIKTRKHN